MPLPGRTRAVTSLALVLMSLVLVFPAAVRADGTEDPIPAAESERGGDDAGPADREDLPAPPPEPDIDLFADLLAASGDGQWRGILNRIRKEKDGAWIGQHLGALFRDRVTYADKEACAAYTAAYLIDRPENDKVLLGAEIVRRAHRSPAFLGALRSHLTAGDGGWERILDEARAQLRSDDARSRAVAVWFLGREDGAQREVVRRDLVAQAKTDLEGLAATTDPAQRALAASYLDAFHTLFQYRFGTVAAAVRELDTLEDLDLAALVLELSRRKDLPSSPLAQKLVDFGKRLVDRVALDGHPAGLAEFLDATRTPMAQVRRYAVQKAMQMGPKVDRVWTDLLVGVIDREEDGDVLRGALGLVEGNRFGEAPELAAPLSAALARRLAQRGPGSVRTQDAVADRVRMARALGALRVLTPELESLLVVTDGLETDVVASLIRALGGITSIQLDAVLEHYRRHGAATPRDEAVRVAVVDALGRPGVRATDGDALAAASALREILTGDGEGGLGRALSHEVRQHAIRSLGSFPGPETAAILRSVALDEDEQEASVAGVVLRKAALKDEHAVEALIEIAQATTQASRRIEALKSLAALGKNPDLPTLDRARSGVRAILATSAPPEVRLEAASASADLVDPASIDALASFWGEDPARVARLAAFFRLVEAVAAASEEHDPAIEAAFESLATTVPWKAADDTLASLIQLFPRVSFQHLRARLLHGWASAEGTDLDAARAQLSTADLVLETVLAADAGAAREALVRLRIRVLAAWGRVAEDGEERKTRYLVAVSLAAESRDRETAGLARDLLVALDEADLAALLSDDERAVLAEDKRAIEAVLQG